MAGEGPDLAGEGGNRSFARRAGDSDHGRRLASDETGSGKSEEPPRIVDDDDGNGSLDRMRGDDGDGTLGNGIRHIGATISLCS